MDQKFDALQSTKQRGGPAPQEQIFQALQGHADCDGSELMHAVCRTTQT